MKAIEIFYKTLSGHETLGIEIKKTDWKSLFQIYFLFTVLNSLMKAHTPPDFMDELSRSAMQISEHGFFYYLTLLSFSDLAYLLLFSLFFIFFTGDFFLSKIKAAFFSLANIAFFVFCLLFLKNRLILSLLISSGLSYSLFLLFSKNRDKTFFLLKILLAFYSLYLVFIPLSVLGLAAGSKNIFLFSGILPGLWAFLLFARLAGEKFRASVSLISFSFLMASFNAVLFFYLLKRSGLISAEVFRIIAFL